MWRACRFIKNQLYENSTTLGGVPHAGVAILNIKVVHYMYYLNFLIIVLYNYILYILYILSSIYK